MGEEEGVGMEIYRVGGAAAYKERNQGAANLVAFLACVEDRRVVVLACAISGAEEGKEQPEKKGKGSVGR